MMRPVVGQGEAWATWIERARSLRLPHGILLEGPPGSGKSTAARELAAALECAEPGARPCGACSTCRRIAAGNHPDLHLLSPPEDKRVIPVEAVRALQASLGLTAVEGRARVVLVDPADALNEQGQNALLKTLEEPGEATFLILAATRPESLLPTVRSRLQRHRLRPLDEDALARLCPGVDPRRLGRLAPAAGGSAGLVRELSGEAAGAVDGLLAGLQAGRITPFAAAAEVLAGAEGRSEAETRARGALRVCAARCRTALAELALAPECGPAYRSPSAPWIDAAEAVFAAEEDLGVEIGAQRVLADLFLRWSELLAAGGGMGSD